MPLVPSGGTESIDVDGVAVTCLCSSHDNLIKPQGSEDAVAFLQSVSAKNQAQVASFDSGHEILQEMPAEVLAAMETALKR